MESDKNLFDLSTLINAIKTFNQFQQLIFMLILFHLLNSILNFAYGMYFAIMFILFS